MNWLLVHPPLLGPAVLAPLADELRRRGDGIVVPDLRPAVDTAPGWPQRWVAAAAASPADAVLGFSGAGVTLPAVAAAVGVERAVWVDALMPAAFYDVAVPVPKAWPEAGARYVQLSAAYDGAAAEARRRGWPVIGEPAEAHLGIANHPAWIADLLG